MSSSCHGVEIGSMEKMTTEKGPSFSIFRPGHPFAPRISRRILV
jgi:hypothetical protein